MRNSINTVLVLATFLFASTGFAAGGKVHLATSDQPVKDIPPASGVRAAAGSRAVTMSTIFSHYSVVPGIS